MEQSGVVAGNFAPSFSVNFLSFFVHIQGVIHKVLILSYLILGSIRPITLIWASLERSFPPAEVEYRSCQFWSKVMTSAEEERPRLVMGGYWRHRHQWVNLTSLLWPNPPQYSRLFSWSFSFIVSRGKLTPLRSKECSFASGGWNCFLVLLIMSLRN